MAIEDRAGEFEARYAHDQEKRFRIETRRNRIVGAWAAAKLGKTGDEATKYAEEIVQLGLSTGKPAEVEARIHKDFAASGVSQSDHQIGRHMQEALAEAEEQVSKA